MAAKNKLKKLQCKGSKNIYKDKDLNAPQNQKTTEWRWAGRSQT